MSKSKILTTLVAVSALVLTSTVNAWGRMTAQPRGVEIVTSFT
jgi:hypothetical protein